MSTPSTARRVAVLICCYDDAHHLDDCLGSVRGSRDAGVEPVVVVVDNGCRQDLRPTVAQRYPSVDCIRVEPNRGFAGGNNAGWAHVRAAHPGCEFIVLLNIDTVVRSGWLSGLIGFLDEHPEAGCVQPKLLLHARPDTFNTAGNRSHFLGFGMMTGCGDPDDGRHDRARPIDFPSGAAVMLPVKVVEAFGLFDEPFHMTLEDADLGWKLGQAGRRSWYCPGAAVLHKYDPTTPLKHYRDLEKNRWALLLTYLRWRTLVLIAPALGAMEIGQLIFAAAHGRLGQKIGSIAWLMSPAARRWIAGRRAQAAGRRAMSDRQWMGGFAGRVDLPGGSPWLLRFVGNPLLSAYWRLVRRFV